MSKHHEYEAGKEARRAVIHEARRRQGTGNRMEALLRYLKAAGAERPASPDGGGPLSDEEIRVRAVDLITDAGGEATTAIAASGRVWVRGHIGCRSEIILLEKEISKLPGVTRVDLRLEYDIDDTDS